MRAIDCQGFAGAFALGVVQAGFELVGKREQVGGFGVPLLEGNRHLLGDGWQAESCVPEAWTPVPAELVFGNPPCSGFSSLSVSIGIKGGDDKKVHADWRGIDASANECMWALITYAARVQPQMVIFESVPQAGKMGLPLMQALRDRLEYTTDEQWSLTHVFHNNLSCGGPAMRKRYFWVASRVPFGVVRPAYTGPVTTLRDCIGDLPFCLGDEPAVGRLEGHTVYDCGRTQRLAWLAERGWQQGEKAYEAIARLKIRPEDMPDCWRTRSGNIARTDSMQSPYAPRRWRYDEPARVLTGHALSENVHPWWDRCFTHREAARIMGFPDEWLCEPAIRAGSAGCSWWGKQLPVDSARWIAWSAAKSLEGWGEKLEQGVLTGDRERTIDITNDWRGTSA